MQIYASTINIDNMTVKEDMPWPRPEQTRNVGVIIEESITKTFTKKNDPQVMSNEDLGEMIGLNISVTL